MEAIMNLFVATVLVMGIFCLVIICRDVVIDSLARRNERKKKREDEEKAESKIEQKNTVEEIAAAKPAENVVQKEVIVLADDEALQEENAKTNTGNVVFDASPETTLDEKYNALPRNIKGYYDEIIVYAASFPDSKRIKNTAYEEYKIGKNRLVRLKIKRGAIICELIIPNPQFKKFIDGNKVSVKQAPAIVKVTDPESLAFVKDSIRIAVDAINEEKEYKKEQKRIRRRELRAQNEQQAPEQQNDNTQSE